ncbi:hypothetical protein VOLCADRAFT_106226 [Volvox carteri f. nagariensis]|uniref:CCHC-type domain-containing protein n=1 Tax=Volvox carteri f. nagariensis TaxID=3068 RepID=D8U5Y5_VOLCA|nr:uncharacterized protein VOLCADRAFT_106226 [Volvox carteri f. nagariensis]EFJ44840.1 hypothetical protein VOLCADRAFT_106226 [Volvox carteri f. nagariensis]|eukprot:XP_002954123.1 hypothetical protein VOLCADRAFT_106226 [Volvox carteri f. nagariensis]
MYSVAYLLDSIEESLSSGTDDEGPRRAPLVEIEMNPVGGPAGDEGSDDEPGPLIDDDEASDWSESDSDDDGEVDEEAMPPPPPAYENSAKKRKNDLTATEWAIYKRYGLCTKCGRQGHLAKTCGK